MRSCVVRWMGLRRKSDSLVKGEKSGQRAIMHEVSAHRVVECTVNGHVAGAVIR